MRWLAKRSDVYVNIYRLGAQGIDEVRNYAVDFKAS
jgi:hypothetical protein